MPARASAAMAALTALTLAACTSHDSGQQAQGPSSSATSTTSSPSSPGVTTDSATSSPTAADPDRVTVRGRSFYWHCGGTGDHLVVFEAGLTGDHRTWEQVTAPLSTQVRFCVYDRANTGTSDPAPGPRTAKDVAADFEALVAAAGIDERFVLVGFSFGGLFAQYVARTDPGLVDGLVLVEANHPDEDRQFYAHLTRAQIAADRREIAANPEHVDINRSLAQTRAAPPLRPLPLVVVSAGQQEDWPPGWDPRLFNRLRAEQQADLAAMVPGGRHLIARTSGHEVPAQQPEVVVHAVRLVLAHLR